jgi:cytidine deaminase
MKIQEYRFAYECFESSDSLSPTDAELLLQARQSIAQAYAPYSRFRVAAVARISDGQTITGTNQENASFPAGICAERTLLSTYSSLHEPGVFIVSIAISYHNVQGNSGHPISPCGICRQSLQEFELRQQKPIRLILGGQSGPVYIISSASQLMPLAFTGDELK